MRFDSIRRDVREACNVSTIIILGLASLVPYLIALGLGDLRAHTVEFVITFFAAFILYLIAVALTLRSKFSLTTVYSVTLFSILFRLILLPMQPTLSDDMFRYVWDGRVQAQGISPYRYPPDAEELSYLHLNDHDVWENINRKSSVTVYPPGAQMAYMLMWRIVGDSVVGFKTIFVIAELVGALLLIQLLRHLDLPRERVLIYLWSPLLIFEVAHAGHVDALMMPLLIAAILFRIKERHWLGGAALAAAVLIKLFPLILLPALMPLPNRATTRVAPTLKFLIAFVMTIILGYAPYVIMGNGAIGFLPNYFNENFNMGAARILFEIAKTINLTPSTFANAITFGGLVVLGIIFALKPAVSPREVLIRCVWLIGWFTITTQNLFSWYLLWLLPLIVLLIEPGKFLGFKFAPMTAWLIFSGTIMLSYLFFVEWRVNLWAQVAEYVPLYVLLFRLPKSPRLRKSAVTEERKMDRSSQLRDGVYKAYSAVAEMPQAEHPFAVGRTFAESLGYSKALLDQMPRESTEAFTGVSNVSIFAEIPRGATVLDVGCGAGLDSLIASQRVGVHGKVIGVDFSEAMLARARHSAMRAKAINVEFCQSSAESLLIEDASVDIALVNGIFNLNPAREKIFRELARVMKPGGVVYSAELILREPFSADAPQDDNDWFA